MAMWDDILNGLGIENGAAKVNQTVDEVAGSERGPGGSFDLNRIRSVLPEGADEQANLIARVTDARMGAMRENLKAPTRTGFQFLGDALSAASVPVAYAQGNTSYGSKMAGNTMADQFNDRRRSYEDKLNTGLAATMDEAYGQIGNTALDHMKARREKSAEVRKTLAGILAAGRRPDGSIDPATLEDAGLFAKTQGFGAEWEELKGALKLGTPQEGAPAAPGAHAQAPAAAPSAPAQTPDPMAGPVLGGLSGMAQNLPGAGAPGQGSALSPGALPTETPAHIQDMYRRAATAQAMGNEAQAKALMAQAQDLSDIWKKQQESRFSRTNVSNSTLVYGSDKDGNPVVMQPSSEGRLIRSQVPEGVQVLGPEGVANKKQLGKDFGVAYKEYQDKAATALDQMALVDMAEDALATGVYTGLGGDAVLGLQSMAVALGLGDEDDVKKLAGGELLTGIQNRMALKMREGGAMPGALSDNDIKFLKASQFGIDKSPEANRQMLAAFRKMAKRQLDVAALADKYVQENGMLDARFKVQLKAWAEANPLFADAAAPAPAPGGERKFKVLR